MLRKNSFLHLKKNSTYNNTYGRKAYQIQKGKKEAKAKEIIKGRYWLSIKEEQIFASKFLFVKGSFYS